MKSDICFTFKISSMKSGIPSHINSGHIFKTFIVYFTLFFAITTACAQLPNTDIWLLDIDKSQDSIVLRNPVNITTRSGYDNQPVFSPDGKYLLYTSIREDNQADIYKFDLVSKQTSRLTFTPTSEYSPAFTPDGKSISVVMVEPDSVQRLWKFPIKGGKANLVLNDIDSIGYYRWISKDSLALILITEPPTLEVVNVNSGKTVVVKSNVGRCMIERDGRLYYTQKQSDAGILLTTYPRSVKEGEEKLQKLKSEDFTFLNSKEPALLNGLKSKIFTLFPNQSVEKSIIDLSGIGIKNISRIAINREGNKLAIVAE